MCGRKVCGISWLCLVAIIVFATPSFGISVNLTATDQGNGGVLLKASASFSTCKYCNSNGDCWTVNSGSVVIPGRCSDSGNGGASCSYLLDRGSLHSPPTRSFTAYGSDCKGSSSDTITISYDNTPSVSVTGPSGTVKGPFNITGTATFKPTLSAIKGYIYTYVNNGYVGLKTCNTEQCTFNYEEIYGTLLDRNHGGPYTIRMIAYGGGTSAEATGSFSVDKTPSVSVTGPSGTVKGPFNITGTATFKPTLSEVKGYIYTYVNNGYVGLKTCNTEQCTFNYEEIYGTLLDRNHGGPYTIRMIAYGGGTSAEATGSFSVDKTPSVSVTGPSGTVKGPFNITGTATFKPTLSEVKGYIYTYVNNGYVGLKTCNTEQCTFNYEEIYGTLLDRNHGGPYTIRMIAYGGGTSAEATGSFSVDKTPSVSVTGPSGTVKGPFNITGTATFKPTLSEVKGYIYTYVNNGYVGLKTCNTEQCTFNYEEIYGTLLDRNHGGPYTIRMIAYGGGTSAEATGSFSVDKTPSVTILSPAQKDLSPFNVIIAAEFKPTLSSTKGSISAYINNSYIGSKSCTTTSCEFNYREITGLLRSLPVGGPYTAKAIASGGGASATKEKTFYIVNECRECNEGPPECPLP